VAIAGCSNVGKSSLMAAVLGRRGLARTSGTPRRTRSTRRGLEAEEIDLLGFLADVRPSAALIATKLDELERGVAHEGAPEALGHRRRGGRRAGVFGAHRRGRDAFWKQVASSIRATAPARADGVGLILTA
jgi:GTP-binding protein EngB required for normal cell division